MKNLEGKIALVTGAAKNVGLVIARELACRGARVIVNYFHSADDAKVVQAEFAAAGWPLHLARASVARRDQVERMFREIDERFGGLDILVNNAASGALLPADAVDEEAIDRALDTNLKGGLWCARGAAPLMAKRGGGAIVNVSTLGGGNLVMANYLACGPAKAAVEALTRYLAVELACHGIRVNTAASGMLVSKVSDAFPRAKEMQDAVVRATPFGRLGRPEDLAAIVAFLASDDARWVTGQLVLADGGLSLGSALLSPPDQWRRPEAPPANVSASTEASTPSVQRGEPLAREVDEIVVVGMGLAVPGANNAGELHESLVRKQHRFVLPPSDRWDYRNFWSERRAAVDKTYQSRAGFITSFRPASGADDEPTQEATTRWLRHSLIEALANVARRPADRFSLAVGYTPDGSQHLEESNVLALVEEQLDAILEARGSDDARARGRDVILEGLRRRYGRGASRHASEFLPHRVGRNAMAGLLPADTHVQMVDTACSSSLYAIDIGIKSLQSGAVDVAVCAGAFGLGPLGAILFSKLNGLSVGGEVRSLDQRADGVLFADGAGAVVLKTRRRAEADGDTILGVLRAFGGSSDGQGKAIYAPNSDGQRIAIERAFAADEGARDQVDWVVAHATGTPAGDLAEFTSLREMMPTDRPVLVTSNKSIIGHTGWAAGVVSLIQVLEALRRREIPAQQSFAAAPDAFHLEACTLRVPVETTAWEPHAAHPRTAAISGFGFGGTNAHLIVSEYDSKAAPRPRTLPASGPIAVVAWSGHFPGMDGDDLRRWLMGGGTAPAASWGNAYPLPSFEKVRMPPTSAKAIDRAQLMVIECADRLRVELGAAWENARDRAGVFIGHMGPTRNAVLYAARCYADDMRAGLAAEARAAGSGAVSSLLEECIEPIEKLTIPSNENSFPGLMPNVIAARVANRFNLHGPNMTIYSGLSSALAACEVAMRYLDSGEIDLALVGGINGNATAAARAFVNANAEGDCREVGEGAVLFALMRESAAKAAALPILATLSERPGVAGSKPARVERGRGRYRGGRTYLGAEGALGMLDAILKKHESASVVCFEEDDVPARAIHVASRLAPPDLQVSATPEPLPTKPVATPPLELTRQVAAWAPFPGAAAHTAGELLRSGTVVLTDQPEFARAPAFADCAILSTKPLPAGAPRRSKYVAAATPEAIEEALREIGGVPRDVLVATNLAGTVPIDDPWSAASDDLLALHDCAFLVLKAAFARVQSERGSFVFLGLRAGEPAAPHPWSGLFTGLCKAAHLELPEANVFALLTSSSDLARALVEARAEWALERALPAVRYDANGARWAERLQAVAAQESTTPPLSADSLVVATGGARGITAEILKGLAGEFRCNMLLLGSNDLSAYPAGIAQGSDEDFAKRRAVFLREQRERSPRRTVAECNREFDRQVNARAALRNLAELEALCGPGKIRYACCDVTDPAAVAGALAPVLDRGRPIDLLINGAGLNRSAAIPSKDFEGFRSIRDIKVAGYRNLKRALRAEPPRRWCNFGSLIGFVGQLGEADYASANDFLASAASFERAGTRDEMTLGWTLWKSVGLGANPVKRAYFEKSGVFTGMSTEEGVHHFRREVGAANRSAVTLPLGQAELNAIAQMFPGFFESAPIAPSTPAVAFAPSLSATPPPPRETPARSPGFYLDRARILSEVETVFERDFDLERDSYLAHHRVDGEPTLPGTFVAEIAAEAALACHPDLQVFAIEKLAFRRFLRVHPGKRTTKKIRARTLLRDADGARLAIVVSTDVVGPGGQVLAADKVHFECEVVMKRRGFDTLRWTAWEPAEERAVPDPYHFPAAPVLLTGPFVSTTKTRVHPYGKRATYSSTLAPNDPVFSSFLVPSILLDGLARVVVLDPVADRYLPLAAPTSIERIEFYAHKNDCELAKLSGIELYVTPRSLPWEGAGTTSRHVAVLPDGTVLLQMKNLQGTVFAYVDLENGSVLPPAAVPRASTIARATPNDRRFAVSTAS